MQKYFVWPQFAVTWHKIEFETEAGCKIFWWILYKVAFAGLTDQGDVVGVHRADSICIVRIWLDAKSWIEIDRESKKDATWSIVAVRR